MMVICNRANSEHCKILHDTYDIDCSHRHPHDHDKIYCCLDNCVIDNNIISVRCVKCQVKKNMKIIDLSDVVETNWIRHARTLPIEEVIECYINEIEEITCEYNYTKFIKAQLKELLKIYVR